MSKLITARLTNIIANFNNNKIKIIKIRRIKNKIKNNISESTRTHVFHIVIYCVYLCLRYVNMYVVRILFS